MKSRKLGQHYLVDPEAIQRIISTAGVRGNEVVVEIGTGRGALTRELKDLCGRLEGFEVDPLNLEKTRRVAAAGNVTLHLADAFRARPVFDVLVSSLPYSRSADFVEWLSQLEYQRAVVVLQEDFVEKITSPPGDRNYRAISAIAQISSAIRLGEKIGREAFSPRPRVDSRIATFVPKIRLTMPQLALIKRLFALRRRTTSSVFARLGIAPAAALADSRRRVYHLSPAEVYQIVSEARLQP